MESTSSPGSSVCARCGARFGCAPVDGIAGPCWCTQLPRVVPVPREDAGEGCWCPQCLRSHIVSLTRHPSGSWDPC